MLRYYIHAEYPGFTMESNPPDSYYIEYVERVNALTYMSIYRDGTTKRWMKMTDAEAVMLVEQGHWLEFKP